MQQLRSANRQAGGLGCLFEVVETLVLTILIFLGIQTFVAQPYKVQQGSMETTLMPDQYVLVDKLSPHWAPYRRGDIIVFDPPETWSTGGTSVPFIKRIIGLPGDTVQLRDGLVYVNGVQLEEPYIYQENGIAQTTDPQAGGASEWVVPVDQLLVMGDHRENSADSRTFGPIEIKHVIGRAWLRYWPFDTFGILATPGHPELDGASPVPLHGDPKPLVMSLALVAVILAIGAGAVVAVSTREAAAAVIGLAVCLVAASLAADPLPSASILGVRVIAALLSAALIRWAAAERAHQPSPLGWPGEALLATAGAVAGAGIATALAAAGPSLGGGEGGGTDGPAVIAGVGTSMGLLVAAGTMLLVIGTAAVLHPRPGLRRAIGLVLVTQAVLLLRVGLAGPATALEEITRAALLVAAAASASALARAIATTDGPEALE